MNQLLLWTWVVCGTPLAIALIQQAVGWSLDAVRATMAARGSAARDWKASDSSQLWKPV